MKVVSKYCLSISGPKFAQCEQQLRLAEFLEFRLDLYDLSETEMHELLRTPKAYIATCRLKDEKVSLVVLKKAIELGASFIDVDIRRSKSFINELKTFLQNYDCQLIMSYHNYEETPSEQEFLTIYKNAKLLGADSIKFATKVTTKQDNSTVLGLYAKCENLVAFGMGELGKITRLASLYYGAPYTYVSSSSHTKTADGQYTLNEMQDLVDAIEQKKSNPIALIGFMGVGKTTVGKALAEKNSLQFIDIDEEIERLAQLSIPEIFETKGENYFRQLETEVLSTYVSKQSIIISCGGGIIQQEENRVLLQKKITPVWLKADVSFCLNNIADNTRPLLQVNNPLKTAQDLYQKREPLYKSSAHIIIDVQEKSIPQICKIINEKINTPF